METAVFDSLAGQYDDTFTFTEVGKKQRNSVWKLLTASGLLSKKRSILEVNCGTGEDAIRFAAMGHTVLATDISAEMINICTQKLPYCKGELEFLQAGLHQVDTLEDGNQFDLIFSNFGGLNCLSEIELSDFLDDVWDLLPSGGSLVMVIMPAFCIWETFYYLLKGSFTTAFRRLQNPAQAIIGSHIFPVYYYNPYKLIKIARTKFYKYRLAPVGLFLPPSYLTHFFSNKPGLLKLLEKLENIFNRVALLACLSDHYYLHLVKK
jgi:ubiquinone/menaquinone biosynthesis C-methylase UbiE